MKGSDRDRQQLKSHFQNAVNLKQNCKIYITTTQGDSFSFYFKKGYLLWAIGSNHRFRRLYRLTEQICPEINCQEIKLREQEISELWEYLLINILYKRKLITDSQLKEVIKAIVREVLFDCFIAQKQIDRVKVIFETTVNKMGAILKSPLFKEPIVRLNYHKIERHIESSVANWQNIDLTNYSPNYAPAIENIEKLKKAVDAEKYQQLFIFINGQKTLRDLASATVKKPIEIANTLLPHIKSKAIVLQEVPDLQLANLYFTPSNLKDREQYSTNNREYVRELELPLIICVDDSPNICQDIAQILNPIGYRLLPVNDAANALMVLLESQPSLIFLDTEMPDANGYELCAQIKKMPAFKHIPIIILSDKENMVDKVRAKIVGAIDTLAKPIDKADLLTMTQKYTQVLRDRKTIAAQKSKGIAVQG